ncbi:MAG TPA: cutinase family protein [Mycobacterium sp.]|nr:cutinase family protein [Mycobacterium sp.]
MNTDHLFHALGVHRAGVLGAALLTIGAGLLTPPAAASAQPCPDVEVVFARGTDEPPGIGGVGQAFVDALRTDAGGRSVAVYPVDYPASSNFGSGIDFARTVVDGISDAATHIESTAANCPNTKMVLGGFSQGAVVTGFVTSPSVPQEVPAEFVPYLPQPMPAEVANHVAAVALFGLPSQQFLGQYGAPPVTIGPLYTPKTIKLCAPDDTICNGAPAGPPNIAHIGYPMNGMVGQAADFAVQRI